MYTILIVLIVMSVQSIGNQTRVIVHYMILRYFILYDIIIPWYILCTYVTPKCLKILNIHIILILLLYRYVHDKPI